MKYETVHITRFPVALSDHNFRRTSLHRRETREHGSWISKQVVPRLADIRSIPSYRVSCTWIPEARASNQQDRTRQRGFRKDAGAPPAL